MTTHERKQFLDLAHQFKLATEANREAFAGKYTSLIQKQIGNNQPVTPVLGFCMQEAGSKERADAMFNYVLAKCNIVYWPLPEVDPSVRANLEIKRACYKYAMVPVKISKHMLVLCGTNPYDLEGIKTLFSLASGAEQYPIFVLSEPDRIAQALTQFE